MQSHFAEVRADRLLQLCTDDLVERPALAAKRALD
jgi:hypothetical protein